MFDVEYDECSASDGADAPGVEADTAKGFERDFKQGVGPLTDSMDGPE